MNVLERIDRNLWKENPVKLMLWYTLWLLQRCFKQMDLGMPLQVTLWMLSVLMPCSEVHKWSIHITCSSVLHHLCISIRMNHPTDESWLQANKYRSHWRAEAPCVAKCDERFAQPASHHGRVSYFRGRVAHALYAKSGYYTNDRRCIMHERARARVRLTALPAGGEFNWTRDLLFLKKPPPRSAALHWYAWKTDYKNNQNTKSGFIMLLCEIELSTPPSPRPDTHLGLTAFILNRCRKFYFTICVLETGSNRIGSWPWIEQMFPYCFSSNCSHLTQWHLW